jgi:hypothetical protein
VSKFSGIWLSSLGVIAVWSCCPPRHLTSALPAGISTAPKRGSRSSSLSTAPPTRHDRLQHVDAVAFSSGAASSTHRWTPCVDESPFASRDVALTAHIASLCFKCFICMLQVFYMDVAKVDRDDAYVAMLYTYVASFCSQCFIYFFQIYVASVFIWCYIYFTHILQVFYLSVAYVLQWFQVFV